MEAIKYLIIFNIFSIILLGITFLIPTIKPTKANLIIRFGLIVLSLFSFITSSFCYINSIEMLKNLSHNLVYLYGVSVLALLYFILKETLKSKK